MTIKKRQPRQHLSDIGRRLKTNQHLSDAQILQIFLFQW